MRALPTLEHHGTTILRASVTAKDANGGDVAVRFEAKTTTANGKTEQARNPLN